MANDDARSDTAMENATDPTVSNDGALAKADLGAPFDALISMRWHVRLESERGLWVQFVDDSEDALMPLFELGARRVRRTPRDFPECPLVASTLS